MKQLKHSVWFMGYYFPAYVALFVAVPLAPLLVGLVHMTVTPLPESAFILFTLGGMAVLFGIIMMLFYLWFHRLTPEEHRLIAEAEPVTWRGITEDEIARVRFLKDDSVLAWLIPVMLFPAGLLGLMKASAKKQIGSRETLIGICAIAVMIAVVVLIVMGITRFWKHIDMNAEAADLHVDCCFTRVRRARYGRKIYHHYAVCYLPDGKYVFRIDRAQADKLIVIRYKRHTCILTPDIPEYDDD